MGYIGASRLYPNIDLFTGYLAAIRVYNRELDKHEIQQLSQEFKPQYKTEEKAFTTIILPGKIKLDMIKVKAGTFIMGKRDGENNKNETEHTAVLTKDFYIGKYEVTQSQWKAIMGNNPSRFKGDAHPVEMISWHEAISFCEKLNARGYAPAGWHFTLPTETQWEYAAKGGINSKGFRFSGSNSIDLIAWYAGNSRGSTHSAGVKLPNELGICDMSGNVWEWCLDDFNPDSRKSKPEFSRGRDSCGSRRVIRGNGWYDGPTRITSRNHLRPTDCRSNVGFRIVLVH